VVHGRPTYRSRQAITLLPENKLHKLIAQYLNPVELRPAGAGKENLFADVKAFQKASLNGKYYQAFAVNSKNYTDKSSGTLDWIADCRRLLERCLAHAKEEDPATVCLASGVGGAAPRRTLPRDRRTAAHSAAFR
jgi:hypothetical protein